MTNKLMKAAQTRSANDLRHVFLRHVAISIGSTLVLLAIGCGPQTYRPPSAGSNRVAPEFVAQTLEGGRMQLSNLRGKVVVLHIWAAWHCADELPGLDEIAARLSPRDVTVIALSVDSDIAMLKGVASSRATWRLSLLHDPTGRVAKLYDPRGFPAAYVIDHLGRIRHTHYGVGARDLPLIEAQAAELSAK